MKFDEIQANDKVRLFKGDPGKPPIEVIGTVVSSSRSAGGRPFITLERMDWTFYENNWCVELVERPWKSPTESGLYASRIGLERYSLGSNMLTLYRLNKDEIWYRLGEHGWRSVQSENLPRDLVRLAAMAEESSDGC